ncbi:MAG: sulfate adenylyltransferase [bacterium]
MSQLVPPHGAPHLNPLLLPEDMRAGEIKRAKSFPKVMMTSRETSDLIMMGIGAFTPLDGFMGKKDWKSVCDEMCLDNGIFWPIPITLSVDDSTAASLDEGDDIALYDSETDTLMGTMEVREKYQINKEHECRQVFKTADPEHPGVQKVLQQGSWNLGGPVKVVSESYYPHEFGDLYHRPADSRRLFEEKGWKTVAALQLRNPMHRSHEYLAKIALEVCDGLYIHQLLGKLKPGDIPAEVRVRCIDVLVENYFVKDTVIQGGYPMEMRYAGPREALLHAVFRQNYGCSHLIVGRDHAGVGNYYGPFDSQNIFHEIPENALYLKPLPIDWTFYCYKCRGMASMKTCPHGKDDRLILSGTMLRKSLSEGLAVPEDFSRPEVLAVLQEYYQNLENKVEIKLHNAATGESAGNR